MANFGKKPEPSQIGSFDSYRIFISVTLFCGVIAWMGYRASLSAQFAAKIIKYPFYDLNSLSETNYR